MKKKKIKFDSITIQGFKGWLVSWSHVTGEFKASPHDGSCRIKTAGVAAFSGPQTSVFTEQLEISLTVTGKGTVEYGILCSDPALRLISTKKVIESDTPETLTFRADCRTFFQFRPFLKITGDIEVGGNIVCTPAGPASCLEGEFVEMSRLPDPQKSNYPDCYYTARFIANGIVEGKPVPQEFILVVPGFFQYKKSPFAGLQTGRKYLVKAIPFGELPTREQSVQQADDLNLFELDNFMLRGVIPVDSFRDSYAINFSSYNREYISAFKRKINPPVPEAATAARKSAMNSDLKRMNEYIARFEARKDGLLSDFEAGAAKLGDAVDFKGKGFYFWRNIDNSFWALPRNYKPALAGRQMPEHNLTALKNLSKLLEANGTQLIIQLIPSAWEISSRIMIPELRKIPDIQSATLVRQLLENDIETVYCTDRLLADYARYPLMFFYPDDFHPADTCQDILTDMIVERLKRYGDVFHDGTTAKRFSELQAPTAYGDKYRWPADCDTGGNRTGETILCRHIRYDGKPVAFSPDAKLLIIGNSYIKTPDPRASYASYIARKLCYIPDEFRVDMHGPFQLIPKKIVDQPERYLKAKHAVILPLSVFHLLADIRYVDVGMLDALKLAASNKKLLQQLELPVERLPETPVKDIDRYIADWRNFRQGAKIERVLPEANRPYELCEVALPENSSGKERICTVTVAGYRLQSLNLSAGDVSAAVIPNHYTAQWQSVSLPVPPGRERFKIMVSAPLPGTVFAVKDISVYEDAE